MCRVSVITPVYNVEKYLRQCLDSLKEQKMKDIEFICVNDGSTDGSLKILNEYAEKDSRFRIISQPNGGYGKAMNTGLRAASGEYIGILESDDWIEGEMFASLYEVAKKTESDIVKSNFCSCAYGKISESNFIDENDYDREIVPLFDTPMIFQRTVSIWSAIYKKSFLDKWHISFHETPGASFQDLSFFIETMACAGKAYFIRDAYLHYRCDNVNSSVKSIGKEKCVFDEFNFAKEFLVKNSLWSQIKKFIIPMKYLHFMYSYNRIGIKHKEKFLQMVACEIRNDEKEGVWDSNCWFDINVKGTFDKIKHDANNFIFNERVHWQKMELMAKGFLNILENANMPLYVYGAGKVAGDMLDLMATNNISIEGIIVSEAEGNPKKLKGIDVLPVSNVDDACMDNSMVIIAVGDAMQEEIFEMLKFRGCKNIIHADIEIRNALRLSEQC